MSNYNFLEGQTPQLIEIDSTFTISHNANTVTFNANESHSLQSFVEKIKNDLGLNTQIDFTEDSYISYRRMQDLFPHYDANDNLGIGTTSPSVRFEVVGNNVLTNGDAADLTNAIAKFTANDLAGVVLGSTNGNAPYIADCNGSSTQSTGLRFLTNSEPRMIISSAGNVGIGTTTPTTGYKLDVNGNIRGYYVHSTGTKNLTRQSLPQGAYVSWNDDGGGGEVDFICSKGEGGGGFNFFNIASDTTQTSNASPIMYISSAGNINASGDITASGKIVTTGNIGIGTTDPSFPLYISSSKAQQASGNENDVTAGTMFKKHVGIDRLYNYNHLNPHYGIYTIGGILTQGFFAAVSDKRIKANIKDLQNESALQTLRLLQPKTYTYKDTINKGTEMVYGFIGQEVNNVLPEATSFISDVIPNIYELVNVSTSEDGSYNKITFTNFDTDDLDTSSNIIQLYDYNDNKYSVNITQIIDNKTIIVDTNLSKWMGAVDISGNVNGNTFDLSGNVIINGTNIFVYGQKVDDFCTLSKESIFTVATGALQEVDRQLQEEKEKNIRLENEISTLKLQMADILLRVKSLESL